MARERLEYDVAVRGADGAQRAVAGLAGSLETLTEQQQRNVRGSKAFAAAHEEARLKAIAARRADLDLAAARDKLDKITKDGTKSEGDRARAALALEMAEIRHAKAVRGAVGAHTAANKAFRQAAAGAGDVEKQSTRAGRALTAMGAAARTSGKVAHGGYVGLSKSVGGVRVGVGAATSTMLAGIPIVGALAVGVGALAKNVYDSAAAMELTDRRSKAVYGTAFPQVEAWAGKVASRAGMTTREMTALATSFADMLQPMGFTLQRSVALSQRFAQMAPILAEWSGGQLDVAGASDALMGALTGEYDTLQRLGIPISAAAVQAELLKRGQDKLTGAAGNQAAAVAALDIIYRSSTAAQNAYAGGATTLAAKQAAATAKFKEVRDVVLAALLPALAKLGDWIVAHQDDFIHWGFAAAAAVIRFGAATGSAVGDVLIGVGSLLRGLGNLLDGSTETWIGITRGAAIALGVINPSAARAAQGALTQLENLRQGAAAKFKAAGAQATSMGENLKKAAREGSAVALDKLEQTRRAALAVPDKTLTQLQVEDRTARTKIREIREKLRDKELTKTRRAKLEADLAKWRAQLKEIGRQKKEIGRSIVIRTGAQGLPSTVKVSRIRGKNGTITGIQIGAGSLARRGMATGGAVQGPGTRTSDSVPAVIYHPGGSVEPAALSDGEHVLDAQDVDNLGGQAAVYRMRKLAAAGKLRNAFAGGGEVRLGGTKARIDVREGMRDALRDGMRAAVLSQVNAALRAEGSGSYAPGLAGALRFARAQQPSPYNWAHQGPKAVGYDCSGYQSAITNVALGRRNPYVRLGSTGTMPWPMFARGPGAYSIGWFRGNPGHMAGTINGVNVESRGGDGVVVGPRARGARDPLFGGNIAHLKGFAAGGRVGEPTPFGPSSRRGDPAFDLISPRGRYAHGRRPQHVVAMAAGGIIREPVSGVGLRSGASYSFGERGAETVTPGLPSGGELHVHFHGPVLGSARQVARELAPAIQQEMRENLRGRGKVAAAGNL